MKPFRTTAWATGIGTAALSLAGCAGSIPAECDGVAGRADFGAFDSVPRARMGGLPFHGPFTLYSKAPREDLGGHEYSGAGWGEHSRGIVYTCDGGFMDISHIRNTVDITAYVHARFRHALLSGWDCVRFRGNEPSHYEVRIGYPEYWHDLPHDERAALIDEAAIQGAQRIGMQVMTWHELITWYGYKSAGVISEKGSAFSYDDGPSHALGVAIAGEALRLGGDFDETVTALLAHALEELGLVEDAVQRQAVEAVQGDWWTTWVGTRVRHLETGLDGEPIVPWLVPDLSECAGASAVRFEVPTMHDVAGHDLSALFTVEIDPRVFESPKIFARLPDATNRVVPSRDFPVLIADIRDTVGEEFTRVEQVETEAIGSR